MQHPTLTVQLPDDEAPTDIDPQHAEPADMNEDPLLARFVGARMHDVKRPHRGEAC